MKEFAGCLAGMIVTGAFTLLLASWAMIVYAIYWFGNLAWVLYTHPEVHFVMGNADWAVLIGLCLAVVFRLPRGSASTSSKGN